MKKRGLILLYTCIVFLLLSGFASSANETAVPSDIENKAYDCLKDQIAQRGNLSLKEAIFAALALGNDGNLVDTIESYKDANSCWPKGACTLKETSQVALAYEGMNKDTTAIKNWILSKNATATELVWFIQIDIENKQAADCTINDGTKDNKITIGTDSKIQGSPGSCLALDSEGFKLRINNNCLDKVFKISCNQEGNFYTSVVYQRAGGGTTFVLPETHSAASLGTTTESVNGKCIKTASGCDYEGTLWAALALQKMGEDISAYMPYLLALADDNSKYFPSAFLYVLGGGEDQYNQIMQQQRQGKFWEMTGTREGRYYDTSLAMIALNSKGSNELDGTKAYLAGIATEDGCWNSDNIRDTAFILFSGWPKNVAQYSSGAGFTGCEESGFSCENAFECTQAGGTVEYNYACTNAGLSCCSIKVQQPTCEEKKGILCLSSAGKECSGGRIESASDGTCCLGGGACIDIVAPTNECIDAGGTCRSSCNDDEEAGAEACAYSGDICCKPIQGGGFWLWFWIIILIILILLLILAIIYRDKVKIWWYRLREKFRKKKQLPPARPLPYAPTARPIIIQQRPVIMQQKPAVIQQKPAIIPQRPVTSTTTKIVDIKTPVRKVVKDEEMEKALAKLREMAKAKKTK